MINGQYNRSIKPVSVFCCPLNIRQSWKQSSSISQCQSQFMFVILICISATLKNKKKNEISIWSRAHLRRGFGASHTTILLLLGKNVGSFQLQVDQLEFTSIKRLFLFGSTFMTVLVALMAKGATYKCVVRGKRTLVIFRKHANIQSHS